MNDGTHRCPDCGHIVTRTKARNIMGHYAHHTTICKGSGKPFTETTYHTPEPPA